ncbi:hypothetical protein [Mongoliitalea lutea]|uniref:Uncharacterized protein n=1 Tax=Mongoliitalea lutea TaxID=849756 RepID=A0A8J3CVZ9_9BACT|nr:hypothetical protein [Mongoliitalea lutea]GHB34467.1 hypothetical protein GCM10008106_14790 [Mongoliitalea lutea]
MRQLTDIELQEIRKAIMRKEISSAEILMEVYDHYISHLQEFPKEEFNEQLFELEQKFTYAYCHALQAKFHKNIDIGKAQWMVIKKYFCTSRILFLAGILAVVNFVATQARTEQEIKFLLMSPLALLFMMHLALGYQWLKRILPIKKSFKGNGVPIKSSLMTPLSMRLLWPLLLANLIFYPKIVLENFDSESILPAAAVMTTVLLLFYAISLMEVWKIKSKSALV